MQQKELSQMRGVFTPEKNKNQKHKVFASIVEIRDVALHDSLIREYNLYKSNQIRKGLFSRLMAKLCGFCEVTIELCREIWREIMPEYVRGDIENEPNQNQQSDESKERKCFEEFKKKKTRFFAIVFDDQSSEDEIQEAFQKASFIMPEGRGITIEQLVKETSCAAWQMKSWSRTKRYSILFFKFDLFEHLLFFGNLTKEMVDANKEDETYFQNFKSQLNQVCEQYEAVEREFVNSYMEKEDRMELVE